MSHISVIRKLKENYKKELNDKQELNDINLNNYKSNDEINTLSINNQSSKNRKEIFLKKILHIDNFNNID